jgi:sugar lactone lactonase YvrE
MQKFLRPSVLCTVAAAGDTNGQATLTAVFVGQQSADRVLRNSTPLRAGLRTLSAVWETCGHRAVRWGKWARATAVAICLGATWQAASAQSVTFQQATPGEIFGAYPGGYSANQNISFINVGPTDSVTQGAVTLTGTNASAFLINNNFCFGGSIAPGAGCNIQVQFATGALTAGNYTATLSIAYTDGVNSLSKSITLNGTVMSLPTPAGNPQLAFVPPVTIAAGTGVGGIVSSGVPATSANLRNPQDVQPDRLGNIYIADTSDNVVRVIYAAGTIPGLSNPVVGDIYTVAGTGTFGFAGDNGQATAATLASPAGLALDASGNLYIADTSDYRVREVNITTGIITTVAGNGFIGSSGDGGLATAAELGEPYGIVFDSKGNLYISDHLEFVVRVVYASGTLPNIASPLVGHIYTYAGFGGGSTTAGSGGFSGDGGPATNAQIWFPYYLAVDASNNLYIGDFDNDRIREVNFTTGIISTVAGVGATGGGAATSEGFSPLVAAIDPTGVATDTSGNLYISDFGGELYEANTAGIVDWFPSVSTASFNIPAGIRFDANNNLYVSDQYNNRIRKISPQGVLAFPSQNVGTTSSPQLLTVQNNGSGPLTFNATPYTVTGNFGVGGTGTCNFSNTLAVGSSCTVAFTFSPLSPGALTGTVSFATNSANSPLVAQLTGTGVGVAAPVVSLNPTPLAFASQTINTTSSPSQVVVLSNTGTAILTGIAVSITGTNANAFGETSACATTLAAGSSCNISVAFTPSVTGANSASLSVSDNATGSPQTVPLTGTGTAALAPQATLSPNPLTFPGTTIVGSLSTPLPMTLTNGGTVALSISSISVFGTSSSSFGQTNNCGTSLAAGASCTVMVTFNPVAPGTVSASISVADNATGTPQMATITGTGIAGTPAVTLNPIQLSFPNTNIGSSSSAQTFTITNTGTATMSFTGITLGGAAPGDFTQSNNCGSILTAGSFCTVTVIFAPGFPRLSLASVLVADNAPGSPQSEVITGTGIAATPQATLSGPVTFASTTVGSAAPTQVISLTNPGNAPLTISSIAITGANASSFSTTSCGSTLAASATCLITIGFSPTASGPLSATLTVTDNATAGSTQTAALNGTGAAAAAPQATLSPSTLTFPSTTVGVAATSLPVTLSNPGTAALTITSILNSGAGAGFGETSNCGGSLAAGASCTLTISFTPTSTGPLTGSIAVSDNATGTPQTVTLNGTGAAAAAPQATLSPNPLNFSGTTTVGSSATALPMTLTNAGSAALSVSGISVTGANASSFTQTNNCGASVAAGSSCTINVTFTPTSAAALTAAISVADNATGSPQSAVVTGTGSTPVTGGAFTVASSTPAVTAQPGGVAQFNLLIAPLGGSYNNLVTLSATGLPTGAQVSFLPAAVTPGSAGAPSVMSIQTTTGLARVELPDQHGPSTIPLLAMLAGLPLLGFAGNLRRLRRCRGRWMLLGLATLAILPLLALSGCGGGYFGPAPKTYTVTVTGTSGSLQESTTVSLTVQ